MRPAGSARAEDADDEGDPKERRLQARRRADETGRELDAAWREYRAAEARAFEDMDSLPDGASPPQSLAERERLGRGVSRLQAQHEALEAEAGAPGGEKRGGSPAEDAVAEKPQALRPGGNHRREDAPSVGGPDEPEAPGGP